jgi:hypothetical protein
MDQKTFDELTLEQKIVLWNDFCYENNWGEIVEYNDADFFNNYFNDTIEAVRAAVFGDYEYHDEYVIFGGDGNLYSFTFEHDFYNKIDLNEMLNYYKQLKEGK